MSRAQAYMCDDCGRSSDHCVKCGRYRGSYSIPALVCDNCVYGEKKDDCVKCGRYMGSNRIRAYLCDECGMGSRANECYKCGR